MTPEEIRAEVTERLARAEYMKDRETIPDMLGMTTSPPVWEDATDCMRQEHRRFVAHLVDALGDLLPTRAQWAVAWTDDRYGTRERQDASIECRADAERFRHQYNDEDSYPELSTVRVEHRYLTDWTEDPA